MGEPTYTDSPEVFQNAAIGQVRMIAQTDPTPEDWRECDGATLNSHQWPLFVQALGVRSPTFKVPAPHRALNGYRFIVKMGQAPPPPPPPPPRLQVDSPGARKASVGRKGPNGLRPPHARKMRDLMVELMRRKADDLE